MVFSTAIVVFDFLPGEGPCFALLLLFIGLTCAGSRWVEGLDLPVPGFFQSSEHAAENLNRLLRPGRLDTRSVRAPPVAPLMAGCVLSIAFIVGSSLNRFLNFGFRE